MNLLAALRPENWTDIDTVGKLFAAQTTARAFLALPHNPLVAFWTSPFSEGVTAWGRGYIKYDRASNTYTQDINPDALIPDDRVVTNVQVILESEIDRSDTTLGYTEHPWTEEQVWLDRLDLYLGE